MPVTTRLDSFICLQCHQIIANARFGSHSEKCNGSIRGPRSSGVSVASTTTAPGQRQYASDHARKPNSKTSKEKAKSKVQSAVYKAREGVLGKACKILTSSGIAPNTLETWHLLLQKHPKGPVPSCPEVKLPSEGFRLPPDLNIMSVLHQFPRHSASGPSGLRIQHLIDAAEIHMATPICASLRAVVNILAGGKAPAEVAKYLDGGSLTALIKNEEGSQLDVRPTVVGEALRRLTGKCLCTMARVKASEFFGPLQLGVACPAGVEKLVHGLRQCIRDHWEDDDFVACKVDLRNAFNEVSRKALLEECVAHFPELFWWVFWCYGQHPTLWHTMDTLGLEQGVQQGDPLGPLLFSLVLHKLVRSIAVDSESSELLFNIWYLDDGTLAGPKDAVKHAIHLIQQFGPSLGLYINMAKCELFSRGDIEGFPADIKVFHEPNLGAPIGNAIFCAKFLAQK